MSRLLALALSLLLLQSCTKTPEERFDPSRITRTDTTGKILSTDSDDWRVKLELSAMEKGLFMVPDTTVSLDGTAVSDITVKPAYPNPMREAFLFRFTTQQPVTVKLVLVDRRLQTKATWSFRVDQTDEVVVAAAMPGYLRKEPGQYRLYYSFSASGARNFSQGYGDVHLY